MVGRGRVDGSMHLFSEGILEVELSMKLMC